MTRRGRAPQTASLLIRAICTHQGCPVNMWSKERNAFVCSCHASIFDPRNGAEVIDGQPLYRLAALGLKLKDGVVTGCLYFFGSRRRHERAATAPHITTTCRKRSPFPLEQHGR